MRIVKRCLCAVEQAVEIYTDRAGGDQPVEGERRVAAADIGIVAKDMAKAQSRGQGFETAAGIGDGGEVRAGGVAADGVGAEVVEVLEQRERFDRAAGFGCGDKERARRVEGAGCGQYGVRVGAVEYCKI